MGHVLFYSAAVLNGSAIGTVVAVAGEIQYTLASHVLRNPLSNRPLLKSTKATALHVGVCVCVYTV